MGSRGGRPGRGWVGAAGVGPTASLGMAEGGWLGESVWVLRWLHTLCWELLWLSFLSNWCWVDRKQRVRCVSDGGGHEQRMEVEGSESESEKRGSDKHEIGEKEASERRVDGGQKGKRKRPRSSLLDIAVENLSLSFS